MGDADGRVTIEVADPDFPVPDQIVEAPDVEGVKRTVSVIFTVTERELFDRVRAGDEALIDFVCARATSVIRDALGRGRG